MISSCPLCSTPTSKNRIVYAVGPVYFQCQHCELYYQSEYISIDEIREFYTKDYAYNVGKGRRTVGMGNRPSGLTEDRYKQKFNKCLRKGMPSIIDGMTVPSSILEIGADAGGCSIYAKSKGHEVDATEVHPEHVKRMRNKGIHVYQDLFEPIDFGSKRYDYIIALEVIEHVGRPVEFIRKVHGLLNESGYFVFETPIAEPGLRNQTDYGFQFAHPCIFNTRNLSWLFKEFSVVPDDFAHGNKVYMVKK